MRRAESRSLWYVSECSRVPSSVTDLHPFSRVMVKRFKPNEG